MSKLVPVLVGAAIVGVYFVARKKSYSTRYKVTAPVMLIGDSLALGLAPRLEHEFANRGVQFSSHARSGSTAPQWLSQGWLSAALAEHPKTVLVSLGTNDSVSKAGAHTYPAFMKDLLAKIRAVGASPIVLAPPKMPWAVPAVSGVPVVAAPASVPRQPDGVHPTIAGYDLWSAAIARRLS